MVGTVGGDTGVAATGGGAVVEGNGCAVTGGGGAIGVPVAVAAVVAVTGAVTVGVVAVEVGATGVAVGGAVEITGGATVGDAGAGGGFPVVGIGLAETVTVGAGVGVGVTIGAEIVGVIGAAGVAVGGVAGVVAVGGAGAGLAEVGVTCAAGVAGAVVVGCVVIVGVSVGLPIVTRRTVTCVPTDNGCDGNCPLIRLGCGVGADGVAVAAVDAEGTGLAGGCSAGRTMVAVTPPSKGTAGVVGIITGGSGVFRPRLDGVVTPADKVPTGKVILLRLIPDKGLPLIAKICICGGCPLGLGKACKSSCEPLGIGGRG